MRNTHKNHGFGFFENGSKGEVKKQDQVKSSLPSPSAGQFSAISAINEFVGGLQIQNDEEILIDFNEDPYLSPPSNQLGSLLLEPLSSEIPMAHTIPETKCGNTKNVSLKMKNDHSDYDPYKLPRKAIIYDYTVHPMSIIERKRVFLSQVQTLNIPFLRPILIDGIGVIRAYKLCSPRRVTDIGPEQFPLIPLVRCLFYWISKGHLTKLCFPENFNPFNKQLEYQCTSHDLDVLRGIEKFNMLKIFDCDAKKWYEKKLDEKRACIITSITSWVHGMEPLLQRQICWTTKAQRDKTPDRLLQPYFGLVGHLMFFSSHSSKGLCIADIILDDQINNEEEFQKFNKFQLSFTEQAKMIKCLYDILPSDKRTLEASVMVAIGKRLKHFLK